MKQIIQLDMAIHASDVIADILRNCSMLSSGCAKYDMVDDKVSCEITIPRNKHVNANYLNGSNATKVKYNIPLDITNEELLSYFDLTNVTVTSHVGVKLVPYVIEKVMELFNVTTGDKIDSEPQSSIFSDNVTKQLQQCAKELTTYNNLINDESTTVNLVEMIDSIIHDSNVSIADMYNASKCASTYGSNILDIFDKIASETKHDADILCKHITQVSIRKIYMYCSELLFSFALSETDDKYTDIEDKISLVLEMCQSMKCDTNITDSELLKLYATFDNVYTALNIAGIDTYKRLELPKEVYEGVCN